MRNPLGIDRTPQYYPPLLRCYRVVDYGEIRDCEYSALKRHNSPARYLLWLLTLVRRGRVSVTDVLKAKYSPELVDMIIRLDRSCKLSFDLRSCNNRNVLALLRAGTQTAFEVAKHIYRKRSRTFYTSLWSALCWCVRQRSQGAGFGRGAYTESIVAWLGQKAAISTPEIRQILLQILKIRATPNRPTVAPRPGRTLIA